MAYQLLVSGDPPLKIWENFKKSCPPSDWDKVLQPYGARDIPHSHYIEFDREEDMTLFVLRFS